MDFLMQEIQTTEIKYKWSPFSTQPLTESITAEPGVQPASPCSTRLRREVPVMHVANISFQSSHLY